MGQRTVPASVTGTPRPRNRKTQIVGVAGELFFRLGYHNVGTEDIAESVGITAGALYRHFRGKQDLLASTITASFDRVSVALDEARMTDFAGGMRSLAEAFAANREFGVLCNRESRHLGERARGELHRRLLEFRAGLAELLGPARPELAGAEADFLARCVFAVLTSPSYHRTAIPIERLAELLNEMAVTVSALPPTTGSLTTGDSRRGGGGVAPAARREAMLASATHLFSTRGYQTVTMDDVGASVGVTSTSVYRHFASKAELLTAVVARGSQSLQLGVSRALSRADGPKQALVNLVDAYLEFATEHHDLLGVLVAEVTNLPPPHRHQIRGEQHDYVAEWFRLVAATRPELDRLEVRFRVHAVLTAVNEVTRDEDLRDAAGVADALRALAAQLLTC